MQLICPKCELEVELDEDGMPEKRRPVRCTNCGESWFTGGKTDLYALSFANPSEIDPNVARILKEEAEREMAARKTEEEERLSTLMDSATTKEDGGSTRQPATTAEAYESLSWRQWSFVLILCLVGSLTALYVFAPNLVVTFPGLTDWIFSYIFLVNDIRQALHETAQTSKQLFISLDIGGTASSVKDWVLGTVQAIVEFGLSLLGSQSPDTKG